MKSKKGSILRIILGGVLLYFSPFVILSHNSSGGCLGTENENIVQIAGILMAVGGLLLIIFGVRGVRKVVTGNNTVAADERYERAYEHMDPDELRKLRHKLEQGLITDDEFEQEILRKGVRKLYS